jgi:hypothetical protein
MRQLLGCLMGGALLLVGYGVAPSPVAAAPVGTEPNAGRGIELHHRLTAAGACAAYHMAPPSVPEGQIGAALNGGPVTGYGPGGMGRLPGSPANRPYH